MWLHWLYLNFIVKEIKTVQQLNQWITAYLQWKDEAKYVILRLILLINHNDNHWQ